MLRNEDIYVIVRHESGKAYALDRQYNLIIPEMQVEELPGIPREQQWIGWRNNAPLWARPLPKYEFTAYWMAHDKVNPSVSS